MVGRQHLACLLLAGASCNLLSRDLDGRDSAGILVDMEAAQPSSAANGVLVRVSSHGGATLRVSIEGGTFVAAASCASEPELSLDGGTSPCACFAAEHQLALSVRPTPGGEALLTLALLSDGMCDGPQLASRQVALQASAVPEIDASVDMDAGINADASIDASAGSDGGSARGDDVR